MSLSERELKVKVQQRATLRTSTTKTIHAAEVAIAESPPDIKAAKTAAESLKAYLEKLTVLDEIIVAEVADEKIDDEIQRAQQYQDHILSIVAKVEMEASSIDRAPTAPSWSSPRDIAPKLPKLEIPKFGGDPLLWEEFWDNFEACINARTDLPVIDKFKYLKSFLDGDALRLADGYRLTVANYKEVVQALKERFGDPEMAVFAHFEALIALKAATLNVNNLRRAVDDCETHIRSLVALGLPESTFGAVFTPLIISKLPKEVKMELYRKNGSQKWTLGNLRTLLKEEMNAREKCERIFGGTSDKQDSTGSRNTSAPKSEPNHSRKNKSSSALLTSPTNQPQARSLPSCVFCSNKHYSAECRTYPDLNSRRKRMQDRCYCCLRQRHNAKDCRSKKPCYFCKKTSHHQSLCPSKFGSGTTERGELMVAATKDVPTPSPPQPKPEASLSLQSPNSKAILQTAIGEVSGSVGLCKARFYFDTGGSRSFISSALAKRIGARYVGEEAVSVGRFRDAKHTTITYRIFEFEVCLPNGKRKTVRMSAENSISCPIQLIPINSSIFHSVKLAEPPVKTTAMVAIDILVGNDYYYDFIGQTQIRCPNGVVLLESPFGFVTGGSLRESGSSRGVESSLLLHTAHRMSTDQCMERLWDLQDIGIKDDPNRKDDEQALLAFENSVQFLDGRYSVKWPWKDHNPELPSNFALALGRLKALHKRIASNEDVLKKYDDTIQEQLAKGIIEEAPKVPDGTVHYLPHHGVLTPSKATTKLRVVYDASAKLSKDHASLNECLHRGPVLLSDLVGILLRWRLHKIAIVSDIEKAFLQVGLQVTDRDVTRFLWLKNIHSSPESSNLQTFRFARVPFGVISSPFLLGATIDHHLKKAETPTAASIRENIYVDNVFGGTASVKEALEYYRNAKDLFYSASMNLREWFSNSVEFLEQIEPKDRGEGSQTSVLGIKWDMHRDTFSIHCSRLANSELQTFTKRRVLQVLASVFDPCGLLAPVTICGKLLIQKLWKANCGWDDPVPSEIATDWNSQLLNLSSISLISLDRNVASAGVSNGELQLHCFCDASKDAYAAAVYLRSDNGEDRKSDLIFAKTRVSPVKPMTVPRLELMAVLIGVRVLKFCKDQLRIPIESSYVWTDSMCVLQWIAKMPTTPTFVRNRITEIQSHDTVEFRHVPTSENPADLPTRGMSCNELKQSQLWWHGPDWLGEETTRWPTQKDCLKQPEVSHSISPEEQVPALIVSDHKEEDVFGLERFSSLQRLLRTTAYVFRFISTCKKKKMPTTVQVCANELVQARLFWEKRVQAACFASVKGKLAPRKLRDLDAQLRLFHDDEGILRCQGRYMTQSATSGKQYPKLLPRNHAFTSLVIMDCHINVLHSGVKHTLAEFRKQYWVTHGRSQIKSVILGCNLCRYYDGKHYATPQPSKLPEFRTKPEKPFAIVGIDYLGPLLIRSPATPQKLKVWLCVFTCAAIRAIHLEVVESLSTEHFLLCFRRFMAIYGRPKLIISDNAKHFQMADRVLNRIWMTILRSQDVQSLASKHSITWKFIPEVSPWMGGLYERMVGLVKSALKKTIHNRLLTLVELQTLITEIASVVNTRPLLYSEDSPESDYLCPAHFLLRSSDQFPTIDHGDDYQATPLRGEDLILKWKRIQSMLNGFWKSWRSSYLQSLQEQLWKPKNRNTTDQLPSVGSVVILKDNSHRGSWKLAVIVELVQSTDGVVRAAAIRIPSGTVTRRPLKLLYPLECSKDPVGISIKPPKQVTTPSQDRQPSSRHAVLAARQAITRQLRDEESDSEPDSASSAVGVSGTLS